MQFLVRDEEQRFLNDIAKGKKVLEIGTFDGGSAAAMLEAGAKEVTTVDIFDPERLTEEEDRQEHIDLYAGRPVNILSARNNLKKYDNCNMLIGDSRNIVPNLQNEYFDVCFIDGNHSYSGVKADYENCFIKLKWQGILAFHDTVEMPYYKAPGIEKLINETVNNNPYLKKIAQIDTMAVYQKVKPDFYNKYTVISYINDNGYFKDIFEYDFLHTLRIFANYWGRVDLLYFGNDKRYINRLEKHYNVNVHQFESINGDEICGFRTKWISQVIDSLPAKIENIICVDADVIFQKNIFPLFEKVKNNFGYVRETGKIVQKFLVDAWGRLKNKKTKNRIKEVTKGDYLFNSGMICGNRKKLNEFLKRLNKKLEKENDKEFGIEQLIIKEMWLKGDKGIDIAETWNYSFTSNKEYLIFKNGYFQDKCWGIVSIFHNTGGNMKAIQQPIFIPKITGNLVTVTISTKNRYYTTLPLCLSSIAMQNIIPKKLILFDDNDKNKRIDLRKHEGINSTLALLTKRGCSVVVVHTEGKGQVANHQKALEIVDTEYIWRVDDDDIVEPDCLQNLLKEIKPDVAAVCPEIWHPLQPVVDVPDGLTGSINTASYQGLCVQWFNHPDGKTKEVEQINSSFLFRTKIAKEVGGYDQNLTIVGHSEETILTHEMYRAGYKLIFTPHARIWHYHGEGGIRTYQDNKELWQKDIDYFNEKIVKDKWNYDFKQEKYVVLANGLGDHFAFKSILPEMIEKYKDYKIVIACGHPQAFSDYENNPNVEITDIRTLAIYLGNKKIDDYSIYKYCAEKETLGKLKEKYETDIKYKKITLIDAFRDMYL